MKTTLAIEFPKKTRTWVNESHRNPNAKMFQQKKQAIICDLDAGDGIHTEYTEAGTLVFDQGMAVLSNDSRANDMVAELRSRKGNHRDRYAYTPNREGMRRDPIHNHTLTTVPLPWNRYDEFGRKIKDDREDTAG